MKEKLVKEVKLESSGPKITLQREKSSCVRSRVSYVSRSDNLWLLRIDPPPILQSQHVQTKEPRWNRWAVDFLTVSNQTSRLQSVWPSREMVMRFIQETDELLVLRIIFFPLSASGSVPARCKKKIPTPKRLFVLWPVCDYTWLYDRFVTHSPPGIVSLQRAAIEPSGG